MIKTAIIIPSRLDAQRLPNKPLKLINNKEMIVHVYEAAVKSNSGDVYVATPDQKIIDVIINNGGKAIKTSENHKTGTDRIFEVFEKILKKKTDIIINLQGDMPNINPQAINELVSYMKENRCDIATLASELNIKLELNNPNVVKVAVKENLSQKMFVNALDFVRSELNQNYKYYHHIGIYGFTNKALMRYVSLKRSKLEIDRNLEQMRALEDKLNISVGYVKNYPLSVDTLEDLKKIKSLMEV